MAELLGGEVVDDLGVLDVDVSTGEDDVRVVPPGARERLEPLEEVGAPPTRHVVNGPARVDEIERARDRAARDVGMDPLDLDAPFPRQPFGLAEPHARDVHSGHREAAAREEDAIAPFPAAELEHPRAGREEPADLDRERRRLRPPDVLVGRPGVLPSPGTSRHTAPANLRI